MNRNFITIYALPDIVGSRILFTTTLHSSRIPTDMKEMEEFLSQQKLCPNIEFDPIYTQYINRLKQLDDNTAKTYNNLYVKIVNEGEKRLEDYKHYLKNRLNSNSTKEEIFKVVHSLAADFQNITIVR